MTRVLVICLGNVNRSPACAAVLRSRNVEVRSAGFNAGNHRAAKKTRDYMTELNYDLSEHRATMLTQEHVDWAEMIVCMTEHHMRRLHNRFPSAEGRAGLLGSFAGVGDIKDTGFMRRNSQEFRDTTNLVVACSIRLCDWLAEKDCQPGA